MRPRIRYEDRRPWSPGCSINEYGHPVTTLDSVQKLVVGWADTLIRQAMRK